MDKLLFIGMGRIAALTIQRRRRSGGMARYMSREALASAPIRPANGGHDENAVERIAAVNCLIPFAVFHADFRS